MAFQYTGSSVMSPLLQVTRALLGCWGTIPASVATGPSSPTSVTVAGCTSTTTATGSPQPSTVPVTSNEPPSREAYAAGSTSPQATERCSVVPLDIVASTVSGSCGAVPLGVLTAAGAATAVTTGSVTTTSQVTAEARGCGAARRERARLGVGAGVDRVPGDLFLGHVAVAPADLRGGG